MELKKNNQNQTEVDIREWFIQNFFAVASVVVVIVNLWLASKLAPLAQGIGQLEIRVSANEKTISLLIDRLDSVTEKNNEAHQALLGEIGNLKQFCH